MDPELKNDLLAGAAEIDRLLRANELMAARLDMVELLAGFLHGEPGRAQSQGSGVDLAWALRRHIAPSLD